MRSYYRALHESVDFVEQKIIPILSGQLNLSQKEEAILGIFYRVHALASSLTRLNKKIDFNAVAIVARTIFELLLDLKILASPSLSSHDLKKFRAYAEFARFRSADKLLKFQALNPGIEENAFFKGDFRKQFVEASGKRTSVESTVVSLWGKDKNGNPKWPDHSTGRNIRERANECGPLYEQKYLEIYSLLNWYAHSKR